MSKKSEAPLWVDVKQSRYLRLFIYVVHILATLSCLILPLDILLKMLLILLLAYSLYFYMQRYQRGFYTFSLRHTEELSWELIEHDHYTHLRIFKSSVLTTFLIVLQVKIGKKQRNLLVCRDALSAEKFRQLFVALKIMKLE
ncbi:protein YgfX [Methyloprofundus sp.]|uniref:protein YgfX n=1 Tax=Methyloprofundus sp. TaxID=2020875 RepID=UPI003D09AE33